MTPAAETIDGSPGSAATARMSASSDAAAEAAVSSSVAIMYASHVRNVSASNQAIEPQVRQLLLNRVLPQPRRQIGEIDAIDRLVLVEAREDYRLLPARRVHVLLQALRADLLHHALHG